MTIQQGDKVIIPAGTTVLTMHPSRNIFVTKRKMTVTVNHIMPGQQINISFFCPNRWEYPQFAAIFDKYDELIMEWRTNPVQSLAAEAYKAARDIYLPVSAPRVCWPGSGGYWNEVETSLVQKIEDTATTEA